MLSLEALASASRPKNLASASMGFGRANQPLVRTTMGPDLDAISSMENSVFIDVTNARPRTVVVSRSSITRP